LGFPVLRKISSVGESKGKKMGWIQITLDSDLRKKTYKKQRYDQYMTLMAVPLVVRKSGGE